MYFNSHARFGFLTIALLGGALFGYAKAPIHKVEDLHALIERGDAVELYKNASEYASGKEAPKEPAAAFGLFMEAAQFGEARAMNEVGLCYATGFGIEKNMLIAIEWWRRAADGENAEACFNLALCYADGNGVDKDSKKAFRYFFKAANRNLPRAMNNLAYCYDLGIGVEQDHERAMLWYSQAARMDNLAAQYNLGMIFLNAKYYNPDIAVLWLKRAADQGHAFAMYRLGTCYERGLGSLPQDPVRARTLMERSAKKGNELAKAWLEAHAADQK